MIKTIKNLSGDQINWTTFGLRLREYRTSQDITTIQAAQELDIPEYQLEMLENGADCHEDKRKNARNVNIIFRVSQAWDLSLNWILNGKGAPHHEDPIDLIPQTLIIHKGKGIRRSSSRIEAESGSFCDEMMEFVIAIDKYQSLNNIISVSKTQLFEIILALGYRKSGPARIAPLGFIIKDQRKNERLNHLNEKDGETLP